MTSRRVLYHKSPRAAAPTPLTAPPTLESCLSKLETPKINATRDMGSHRPAIPRLIITSSSGYSYEAAADYYFRGSIRPLGRYRTAEKDSDFDFLHPTKIRPLPIWTSDDPGSDSDSEDSDDSDEEDFDESFSTTMYSIMHNNVSSTNVTQPMFDKPNFPAFHPSLTPPPTFSPGTYPSVLEIGLLQDSSLIIVSKTANHFQDQISGRMVDVEIADSITGQYHPHSEHHLTVGLAQSITLAGQCDEYPQPASPVQEAPAGDVGERNLPACSGVSAHDEEIAGRPHSRACRKDGPTSSETGASPATSPVASPSSACSGSSISVTTTTSYSSSAYHPQTIPSYSVYSSNFGDRSSSTLSFGSLQRENLGMADLGRIYSDTSSSAYTCCALKHAQKGVKDLPGDVILDYVVPFLPAADVESRAPEPKTRKSPFKRMSALVGKTGKVFKRMMRSLKERD